MKGERALTRSRFGFAALVGLLATMVFLAMSSMAAAGTERRTATEEWEPLGTNVPYLAWLGEEVRLVKCYEGGTVGSISVGEGQENVDFTVVTWSGDPHFKPEVEKSSIQVFTGTGEHAGDPCVSADIVSLKPGLAQVEMAVNIAGRTDSGSSALDKHVFLVGWMTIGSVVIDEISCTEFGAPVNAAGVCQLSDPLGDGNLGAPRAGGGFGFGARIGIDVTGVIPTGQDSYAGLFAGDRLTLPNDWRAMANVLAEDNIPGTDDTHRWDIHDDQLALPDNHILGHPAGTGGRPAVACLPNTYRFDFNPDTVNETVDNCLGGSTSYSTIFGMSGWPPTSTTTTWGPFDPTSPRATLLADGRVNAGDAPMPALELNLVASGIWGSFREVLKTEVYSRDGQGGNDPHNLYAPFYASYLPATERPVAEASGIAGPRHGNNFEGFLDCGRRSAPAATGNCVLPTGAAAPGASNPSGTTGPYVFWRFADVLVTGEDSNCLFRDPNGALAPGPAIFRAIEGPRHVAIYSDEHGEAFIDVNPNTGLGVVPDSVLNEQGGCDLTGLPLNASFQAFGKYPYKPIPGFRDGVPSNVLNKTIGNVFQKTITCRPKLGPGTDNEFICTLTAIDFNNVPFANELVCITTAFTFDDARPNIPNGFLPATPPAGLTGRNLVCTRTNALGIAEFIVEGTGGNVNAHFVEEEIKRVVNVPGPGGTTTTTGTATTGTATTTTTGAATTTTTTGGATTTTTGGTSPTTTTTGTTTTAGASATPTATSQEVISIGTKVSPTAQMRVVTAKLRVTKAGRYVVVRVNGTAKVVRLRIKLLGSRGQALRTVVRTVPTNRLTQVPNLRLDKRVKAVQVRLGL